MIAVRSVTQPPEGRNGNIAPFNQTKPNIRNSNLMNDYHHPSSIQTQTFQQTGRRLPHNMHISLTMKPNQTKGRETLRHFHIHLLLLCLMQFSSLLSPFLSHLFVASLEDDGEGSMSDEIFGVVLVVPDPLRHLSPFLSSLAPIPSPMTRSTAKIYYHRSPWSFTFPRKITINSNTLKL